MTEKIESRRTFLKQLVGVSLGSTALAYCKDANWQAGVPPWVPPGFPAFYEDTAFSNLIVHKQPNSSNDYNQWPNNGGDTAQREGFTWLAISILQEHSIQPIALPTLAWPDAIKLLEDPNKPGEFRRHPDPQHPDWSDPSNFSRDQQTPIVAALGALGPSATLQRLWTAFDKRARICQNGDAGGPDHQNLFFRALGAQNLGTLKIEAFGEFLLALMVESIAARGAANPDDVGDDLNFIVNLAAAKKWRPTRTSDTTLREYAKTRPTNYGCYLERYRKTYSDLVRDQNVMMARIRELMSFDPEPECHPIIGALRWYFRTEAGAPWGPAALYEQVLPILLA